MARNPGEGKLKLGVLEGGVMPCPVDGAGDGHITSVLVQADLLIVDDALAAVAGAGRGNHVFEGGSERLSERHARSGAGAHTG